MKRAWVIIYSVLVFGGLAFVAIRGEDTRSDVPEALRLSQFEGCVLSGNVLREQVREEFVDLKKAVIIPVFAGVAATIPEGAPARTILAEAVRYMERRIETIDKRIPNALCLNLYPPLDGQNYPPGLVAKALEQAEAFDVRRRDLSRGGDDDARGDAGEEPQAPGQAGSPGPAPPDSGAPDGGDGGPGPGGVDQPPPAPTDPPDPSQPPPPVGPPAPPAPEPKPPTVGGLGLGTPLDPVVCQVRILCERAEARP